ncbi:MAG: type II toxin-antitoxin system YafQ family toxin [Bacteroidaceae bacterium]|nr:type II toxin-antitoxin system YafQ family toxin [Bacteroidaceae bacterium]
MKTIRYSTQYKKDIKRYANKQEMLDELLEIVKRLEQELPIPPQNHPHQLKGKYKGCWECHIESDFLLIWIDEKSGIVSLERLGTHSELFRK